MLKFGENKAFLIFMERLVEVLKLNLLWLAFCLPIVTIGASTVAAFSVCLKMIDGEEGRVGADFIRAFRENFKQGSLLWLLNAVVLYAFYLDWQIVAAAADPPLLLLIAGIVSVALAFCAFVYAYPLVARYRNSLRNDLINSIRICFRFFGKTFLIFVVLFIEVVLFTWNEIMMFFGVLIGPMLMIYTISGIARRIFAVLYAESSVQESQT